MHPAHSRLSLCLLLFGAVAGPTAAQVLGPPFSFPGDAVVGLSPEVQTAPAIAAGGPGYLAVWEDRRPNLSGAINSGPSAVSGSGTDIYGAVLDAAGDVLVGPILIATEGMDQTDPQVSWNGQHWLVVWESQRPDWYFFEDIVGRRVAPDGSVLDAQPIVIRPENNSPSNDLGENPTVTSNGTDWAVVWKAIDWGTMKIILQATRVAGDGTVLDPGYKTVYTHTDFVFGPDFPTLASIGGEYLLAWDDFGEIRARKLAADLTPLGPAFLVAQFGTRPELASNGLEYFLVERLRAYRIAPDGTALTPGGIPIPDISGNLGSHTQVAWTGTNWAVTYAQSPTGSSFDDIDVWMARIAPNGAVLDPTAVLVAASPRHDFDPVIAGGSDGSFVVSFAPGTSPNQQRDDVLSVRVLADGTPEQPHELGNGQARQEHLTWVTGNGVHLAVFVSRSSGMARVLTQRFDLQGNAIDLEPTLVHQGFESVSYAPGAAWNGTHYLVTWRELNGFVLGRRLTANNQVIGFGDTLLLDKSKGRPAVSALGGNFLVTTTYSVSGDLSYLQGIRVDGATGFPIEAAPFTIGFDFALDPVVSALGDRWLVVWSSKPCHDCPGSTVFGRFVTGAGTLSGGSFQIEGVSDGLTPALATAGDRALVVWSDSLNIGQDDIEGRFVRAGGGFDGPEFTIAGATGEQRFPSVSFDGAQFVVSWADYRHVQGVEQPRAEIYASRVTTAGVPLDPAGIQLTSTQSSEDYPANASNAGRTLIGYLGLDGVGGVPEVPRATFRTFDDDFVTCQDDLGFGGPGTATLSVCGDALASGGVATLLVQTTLPGAPLFLALGTSFNPTPLFGGTVVVLPPSVLLSLSTDGAGELSLPGITGGGGPVDVFAQAAVLDLAQPGLFQFTNAVKLSFLP